MVVVFLVQTGEIGDFLRFIQTHAPFHDVDRLRVVFHLNLNLQVQSQQILVSRSQLQTLVENIHGELSAIVTQINRRQQLAGLAVSWIQTQCQLQLQTRLVGSALAEQIHRMPVRILAFFNLAGFAFCLANGGVGFVFRYGRSRYRTAAIGTLNAISRGRIRLLDMIALDGRRGIGCNDLRTLGSGR